MPLLSKIKQLKPFLAPRRPIWVDPDTNRKFIAKTRTELVQKIVNYRAQNELDPIENLDLVLNNYWCSLPENKGNCQDVTLERGWLSYIKGGIALIKTLIYDNTVDQEEADRRAAICVQCPKNVDVDKSAFMTWADEMAEHMIGDRKSTYHEQLGNCAVCSCVLKAKVFYGGNLDLPKDEYEQLPEFCWVKKEMDAKK